MTELARRYGLPAALITVILAVAVVVAYLATRPTGATSPPSQPDKATVRIVGYLTLHGGQFIWDKEPLACAGYRGYDDLKKGTQVVVTDAAGTTIALGQLPVGVPIPDTTDATRALECRFPFTVDAPAGHQFYGIEIARRGRTQYTPAQLEFPVYLTIG